MLVDLDLCPGQPASQHERGVVELVAEDEAPFLHEGGNISGVGGEAHPNDDGVLLPNKLSDQGLQLVVDVQGACIGRGGRKGITIWSIYR